VVATWTAETILGSGLRLVISQFVDISNIANPTFDAELAIRTTVNARLLKTPQRQSGPAGASGLTLDWLDKKDPSKSEAWTTKTRQNPSLDGDRRRQIQAAAAVLTSRTEPEMSPPARRPAGASGEATTRCLSLVWRLRSDNGGARPGLPCSRAGRQLATNSLTRLEPSAGRGDWREHAGRTLWRAFELMVQPLCSAEFRPKGRGRGT
jgi:hypothetical protein